MKRKITHVSTDINPSGHSWIEIGKKYEVVERLLSSGVVVNTEEGEMILVLKGFPLMCSWLNEEDGWTPHYEDETEEINQLLKENGIKEIE